MAAMTSKATVSTLRPTTGMNSLVIAIKGLLQTPRGKFLALLAAALCWCHRRRMAMYPRGLPYFPHGNPLCGLFAAYYKTMHNGRHLEFLMKILDSCRSDTVALTGGLLSYVAGPQCIYTLTRDPFIVERVLKNGTSKETYVKGETFKFVLEDLLGEGIFVVDGKAWSHQRKTASWMFTANNFQNHIWNVLERQRNQLQIVLGEGAARPGNIDLFNVFLRFTLDAIGEIGFGRDIGSLHNPDAAFLKAFDLAQRTCSERVVKPWWFIERWLGYGQEGEMKRHLAELNRYSLETVRQLRAAGPSETDNFVSLFIRTMDKQGTPYTEGYLRDLVLNFLIAGRDTTAHALSWLMFLVMQHGEVEKQMLAEIDTVVGAGPLKWEHLESLKYMQAVIDETLRLFPSVPRLTKVVAQDDTLPDGTFLPKDTLVIMHLYGMGRSTKLWGEDAAEFRPERWLEASFTRPSNYKYPAFNAGERLCLGMRLAWFEMKACLATIMPLYKFKLAVPREDIIVDHSLTNGMLNGMPVEIEHRVS